MAKQFTLQQSKPRLMTLGQVNIRETLESLSKRQCELTKANIEI